MDAQEIQLMLEGIKGQVDRWDFEGAHSLEDDLVEATLRTIADGCAEPEKLAELTLQTYDIEFPRWSA